MHRRKHAPGHLLGDGRGCCRGTRASDERDKRCRPAEVIYRLSDLDKVAFVLGNIQNHLDGVGGPDRVTIALVIHGPPCGAFHASGATREVGRVVGRFSKSGLQVPPRARHPRQHHEGAACRSEGFAARICQGRDRRGGADRRTAIRRLHLRPWRPAVRASPQDAFRMPLGVGSDRSILGSIHYEWRYPGCEGIVMVGSIDNRDCSAECWNREKASHRT